MSCDSVTALDLCEHAVDIRRGKIVAGRGANDFQFFSCPGAGIEATSGVEGLADPLGNGHAAGAGDALDFPIFGILKYDLQAFGHIDESI